MTARGRLRPGMLLDRHYWWKALRKLRGTVGRERAPEVLADDALRIVRRPGRAPESAPDAAFADVPSVLCVTPRFDYGDPARGLSYEENNFCHAFAALGLEVGRFDFLETARRHGRGAMNRMLLEAAYRWRPRLAFFVLFRDELEPTTVESLSRELGIVTVNWFTDDHWRFEDFSRRWAPHFDWAVTTDPRAPARYRSAGIENVILSQWGFNPHLYQPMGVPKAHDVVFVGQPYGHRRRVIRTLRRAGIDVRAWGHGWPAGRLSQREMVRALCRARIGLNLSGASRGGPEQIKGRVFEIAGTGTFLLTERAASIEEYYDPGREIACFGDEEELIAKVRHYLREEGEREAIARRGRARSLAEHTWEARFRKLLPAILGGTSPAARPPREVGRRPSVRPAEGGAGG